MKPTFLNLVRFAYQASGDKSVGQRIDVLTGIIGPKTLVAHLDNSNCNQIVEELRYRGLSGSTINRYLSILSRVVSLYRRGYDTSFVLLIPWQKEASGRFEWLRKADEDRVIKYLNQQGLSDVALSIEILTSTGMRLGEFLTLEPSQVEESWVRLWTTKTNRPRSIPIRPELSKRLLSLVERGVPAAHTIRRGLKRALEGCGIDSNITPHSLRHTTATRLIQKGVNVMVAKDYLGHSSLKTTQRYVHIENNDLTAAMELLTTAD